MPLNLLCSIQNNLESERGWAGVPASASIASWGWGTCPRWPHKHNFYKMTYFLFHRFWYILVAFGWNCQMEWLVLYLVSDELLAAYVIVRYFCKIFLESDNSGWQNCQRFYSDFLGIWWFHLTADGVVICFGQILYNGSKVFRIKVLTDLSAVFVRLIPRIWPKRLIESSDFLGIWWFRLTSDRIDRHFGQIFLESDDSIWQFCQPSDGMANGLVSRFGQILGINLTKIADKSINY